MRWCARLAAALALAAAAPEAYAQGPAPGRPLECSELRARVADPKAKFADVASPVLVLAEAQGMKALYYNDTTLPPEVREAIRARMTHFVACAPAAYKGQAGGLRLVWTAKTFPAEWYANVLNFRTWPGYSEPERLGMEFAERFVLEPAALNADDAFWRRAHDHFTDAQLFDMALMASTWKRRIDIQTVLGSGGPSQAVAQRVERAQADPAEAVGVSTLAWVSAAEKRLAASKPKP